MLEIVVDRLKNGRDPESYFFILFYGIAARYENETSIIEAMINKFVKRFSKSKDATSNLIQSVYCRDENLWINSTSWEIDPHSEIYHIRNGIVHSHVKFLANGSVHIGMKSQALEPERLHMF